MSVHPGKRALDDYRLEILNSLGSSDDIQVRRETMVDILAYVENLKMSISLPEVQVPTIRADECLACAREIEELLPDEIEGEPNPVRAMACNVAELMCARASIHAAELNLDEQDRSGHEIEES